jgi:hypothetical protein
MTTASLPIAAGDRSFVRRVIAAGLIVGVLDMFAASIYTSLMRQQVVFGAVWRGVARALLAPETSNGALSVVLFGLAMHYTIAMLWTALFALVYRRAAWLRASTRTTLGALVTGALYGPFVWMMMSLVLVPLTRAGRGPAFTKGWFIMAGIHIVCVGLPIAWVVRDGLPERRQYAPSFAGAAAR